MEVANYQAQQCSHTSLQMNTAATGYKSIQLDEPV